MAKPFHTYDVSPDGQVTDHGRAPDKGDDIQNQWKDLKAENDLWRRAQGGKQKKR